MWLVASILDSAALDHVTWAVETAPSFQGEKEAACTKVQQAWGPWGGISNSFLETSVWVGLPHFLAS